MITQVEYDGIRPELWSASPLSTNVAGASLYEVREMVNDDGPQCVVSVSGPHTATVVHTTRPLSNREAARARVAAKRNYRKAMRP